MLAHSGQNLLNIRTSWYVNDSCSTNYPKFNTNADLGYSVMTDLVCALLPVAVLWKVRISLGTKIGVSGLMSLGLIATAVAIVRASSLGLKTADLSYDYCIAAIWANTELHIGIIATNLALSRMIWSVFWRSGGTTSSSQTPYYYSTRVSVGNRKSGLVGAIGSRRFDDEETIVRASVDNSSQASQIPLTPVIQKTTSVHVSSGPPQRANEVLRD